MEDRTRGWWEEEMVVVVVVVEEVGGGRGRERGRRICSILRVLSRVSMAVRSV